MASLWTCKCLHLFKACFGGLGLTMCPFSHGIFILLGVCCWLQTWSVCAYPLLSSHHHDNKREGYRPVSSLALPPPSPDSVLAAEQPNSETADIQSNSKRLNSTHLTLRRRWKGRGRKFSPGSDLFSHPDSFSLSEKNHTLVSSADVHFRNIPSNVTTSSHGISQVENSVEFYRTRFAAKKKSGVRRTRNDGAEKHRTMINPIRNRRADKHRSVLSQSHKRSKRSLKTEKNVQEQESKSNMLHTRESTTSNDITTHHRTHIPQNLTRRRVSDKQTGSVMVTEQPITYLGLDGKALNVSEFIQFLKRKDFQRQLNREAQWAYMCLVMLICLMMWVMWYLGGLDHCRYRPDNIVRFTDSPHTLSVHEVLQRKQQYLPMFNEPEWEDVLMFNRGTDP